jgi:Leucine-rich repeat (LRR) protein
LKELVLSHNTITEFPYHLFNIPSLTSLSLSHNPLERAPTTTALTSPAILDLRMEGTGLTAFPTKVCGLYTLKALYLSDNQLSILPPEVSWKVDK